MKIAGTIILYNPKQEVTANILSYNEGLGKLYILDNSDLPDTTLVDQFNRIPHTEYTAYLDNQGIALRLNQAADMARKAGFTHLLTMDQDSSFPEDSFKRYVEKADQYLKQHDDVGVFAVNFQPKFMEISAEPRQVLSTITSGSIINLEVHAAIGGYSTDLFLDLVDADLCYRVDEAGYKTILFSDIILDHTIGYHVKGRSLKNFKVTERKLHPPVRLYYLVRNALYLLHKRKLKKEARAEIKLSLTLLKNNLIYNKRGKVLKYIYKAYVDYKRGKMGKLES